MALTIPAIFDAGVFRPLVPVTIAEGTRVEIPLPTEIGPAPSTNSWIKFIEDIRALPDEPPTDGFSNRDHDKILYGA